MAVPLLIQLPEEVSGLPGIECENAPLGYSAGSKSRKPVAFVEAVFHLKIYPYISEFRDLLDAHDLDYGMFGPSTQVCCMCDRY